MEDSTVVEDAKAVKIEQFEEDDLEKQKETIKTEPKKGKVKEDENKETKHMKKKVVVEQVEEDNLDKDLEKELAEEIKPKVSKGSKVSKRS